MMLISLEFQWIFCIISRTISVEVMAMSLSCFLNNESITC